MTRKTNDTSEDRARRAKGSVENAIGKITGNIAVAQRGASRDATAARPAARPIDADTPSDADDKD